MDGRIAGLTAAALLTAGLALAGDVQAPRAVPVIDVRQSMPEWVAPGEAFPIDIVVGNLGTAVAEGVTVRTSLAPSIDLLEANPVPERLPGALLWALGPLTPGQQRTVRLRVAPRPGAAVAEVRSPVQVTYQTSVGSTAVTQVRRPQLELAVTGPDSGLVGEPVTFQIVVRNRGLAAANGAVLETLLPAGLTHPGGSDLENDIGTLGPGETRQIALRVTPTAAGDLTQRVRLTVPGEEPVERQVLLRAQDLRLRLVANGPHTLVDGWPASYELSLRNEGADVLPQARLVASLPSGLAFVGADGRGVYAAETHSVAWDLGDLRPGEERSLLWNGMARGSGEQVCEATVTSGARTCKRLSWKTILMRAATAPPAMPTPVPPLPDLAAPPPPTPFPASPPAPSAVGGSEATAPGASADMVAVAEFPAASPGPRPPEPGVWRPTHQPPQQGQVRTTAPTASP
jgi:uncharacterized repeat protein (TIGR01451 family)